MTSAAFSVASRRIGQGSAAFIVAEIGANHAGDPATAHELVDIAAQCGVDAVKFQTYTSAELVADADRIVTWGPPGEEVSEPIGVLFDRVALDRAHHGELFAHARELGLIPFSTPFSEDGVRFLVEAGCPMIKLASSDVGHLRLIEAAAATGLPVLLSTGKSTLAEIDTAVAALRQHAPGRFAIMHCVAAYPAPLDSLNLRLIPALAGMFPDAVIGFSDHSIGAAAPPVAVTLGASVIEKHLTKSHSAGGPDDWFSADPDEMHRIVKGVRDAEAMLGDGRKVITAEEMDERRVSTRSLVLARPVRAGHRLGEADIKIVRPGYGIEPAARAAVVGLRLTADRPANWVLSWSDFA